MHVPYRGAAPALQDLLGGQLDFMFDPGIGLQHVKAGKLKLLAVGSPKRSPLFPDVPTLDEVGPEGLRRRHRFGFYAPAARPRGGRPPQPRDQPILARRPCERMIAIGASRCR